MNDIHDARADRNLLDALSRRQFLLIVALYWSYVTLSNVLYAHSFSITLADTDADNLFAPWPPRVLQHLILLVPLLLCVRLSLRIGWQPLLTRLPAQAALAVSFAALPHWVLGASLWVTKSLTGHIAAPKPRLPSPELPEFAIWTASGTNFLLQYGFGLALVTGFALYQRYRDAELQVAALEKQTNAARLSALRMQLSPHTLFNLLNTIRGQIGFDPVAAQQLVVQLSDLLRKLLNAGEREFSTLRDELRFAELYLSLQRSRFEDRLRFELPPADSIPDVWVPSLILQPLVENAVVHGLAGHERPVLVQLALQVDAEQLTLQVTNDIGHEADPHAPGIGLRNVRERLQAHFGTRATFTAGPIDGNRWRATLSLPAVRSR